MKYGESAFDILYLLFAVISGCVILRRAKDKTEKYMGTAALVLGCGDAFHLIPRVIDHCSDADMTAALGLDGAQAIRTMSKGTKEKLQLILTMSRSAKLYLLDEPIGGVDPATRDYILRTIISNYSEDATVLISTHLIADVEQVLDTVIFLREGRIMLQESVDTIRNEKGKSVDALFREVFAC